ncbi:MAG: hypothetical protein JW768_14435, partial [Chitinispirillaceae bacterium]|nr:hypothetical protein [Chitinispirillaceae bacterium]
KQHHQGHLKRIKCHPILGKKTAIICWRHNVEVREKAIAAIKWTEQASKIEGSKHWEYKLVPEDAIGPGREFGFVIGHSMKIT